MHRKGRKEDENRPHIQLAPKKGGLSGLRHPLALFMTTERSLNYRYIFVPSLPDQTHLIYTPMLISLTTIRMHTKEDI